MVCVVDLFGIYVIYQRTRPKVMCHYMFIDLIGDFVGLKIRSRVDDSFFTPKENQ